MKLNSPAQLKTTLLALCRQPGKIAILTHKSPDGDGLAAALALQQILQKSGFKNDIVLEEPPSKSLDFLHVKENTIVYQPNMDYKILILLDCHEPERTGKTAEMTEHASVLIAIDHHQPQNLNKRWYYYIKPETVSAGAIIFTTFRSEIASMPPEKRKYVTDCLYTTVLNDTDGFMNSNTDAEVFRISAQMTEMGTNPHQLMETFILNNPPAKLRFVGNALSSIETTHNDEILFFHTTLAQLAENGLDQSDTNKITKWIKGSTGVKAFIYAREIAQDSYRLSLRSTAVNCNKVCGTFGGGGHNAASGCSIEAPFDEMKKLIIDEVKKQLNG